MYFTVTKYNIQRDRFRWTRRRHEAVHVRVTSLAEMTNVTESRRGTSWRVLQYIILYLTRKSRTLIRAKTGVTIDNRARALLAWIGSFRTDNGRYSYECIYVEPRQTEGIYFLRGNFLAAVAWFSGIRFGFLFFNGRKCWKTDLSEISFVAFVTTNHWKKFTREPP